MQDDPKQVSRTKARATSLTTAAVFLLLAGLFFYRGRPTVVYVLLAISLGLAVIGLFIPPVSRWFHIYWMKLALALGYVNSRILLTIIYFLIFVPYGVVSRLVGRDPLKRRQGECESYWQPRERQRQEKEQFERMF